MNVPGLVGSNAIVIDVKPPGNRSKVLLPTTENRPDGEVESTVPVNCCTEALLVMVKVAVASGITPIPPENWSVFADKLIVPPGGRAVAVAVGVAVRVAVAVAVAVEVAVAVAVRVGVAVAVRVGVAVAVRVAVAVTVRVAVGVAV